MGVLAKISVLDRIEVLEDGALQLRFATYVTEDGVRISAPQYHRTVAAPGETIPAKLRANALGDEIDTPARLTAVAAGVWTKDVVDAYVARVLDAQIEALGQRRGRP